MYHCFVFSYSAVFLISGNNICSWLGYILFYCSVRNCAFVQEAFHDKDPLWKNSTFFLYLSLLTNGIFTTLEKSYSILSRIYTIRRQTAGIIPLAIKNISLLCYFNAVMSTNVSQFLQANRDKISDSIEMIWLCVVVMPFKMTTLPSLFQFSSSSGIYYSDLPGPNLLDLSLVIFLCSGAVNLLTLERHHRVI